MIFSYATVLSNLFQSRESSFIVSAMLRNISHVSDVTCHCCFFFVSDVTSQLKTQLAPCHLFIELLSTNWFSFNRWDTRRRPTGTTTFKYWTTGTTRLGYEFITTGCKSTISNKISLFIFTYFLLK